MKGKALTSFNYMKIKATFVKKYVKVWGCFFSKGVGDLQFTTKPYTSKIYCAFIKNSLMSLKGKFGNRMLLQQDNERKNTSYYTVQWISEKQINLITWPKRSGNISPIENL